MKKNDSEIICVERNMVVTENYYAIMQRVTVTDGSTVIEILTHDNGYADTEKDLEIDDET